MLEATAHETGRRHTALLQLAVCLGVLGAVESLVLLYGHGRWYASTREAGTLAGMVALALLAIWALIRARRGLRSYQVNLKTLAVLAPIVASVLTVLGPPVLRVYRERAVISALGGRATVTYDYQSDLPSGLAALLARLGGDDVTKQVGELTLREVTDDDLARLTRLQGLRRLTLVGSRVTDKGIAGLAPLPRLEYLRLQMMAVTGRTIDLPALREFQATFCSIDDTGLAALARSRKLERLELARTMITDTGLSHFAGHPSLKELKVFDAGVSVRGVAGVTTLEELFLDQPAISKSDFHLLAGLPRLRRLELTGCGITGHSLELLAHLPLERMSFNGSQLDDVGLKQLARFSELRHLSLQNTRVTDESLEPLSKMTGLEYLNLDGTQMTLAGIRRLGGKLPHCEVLNHGMTGQVRSADNRWPD